MNNIIVNIKKWDRKLVFEIIFIVTVAISFLLWLGAMFIEGSESVQFNLFFLRGDNFLADATNVTGYSALRDPYNNIVNGISEKPYPPLTYCVMYLMSRISRIEDNNYLRIYTDPYFLIMYILFTCILMVLVYELFKYIKSGSSIIKIMSAIVFCLSSPIIFSIERGNTIIFVMLLCTFYIFFYNSNNKLLREIAYIALAIAAALKMTPAILGIFLLYEKKYKEAFRTIIYGIFITFIPFLMLEGGFNNIPNLFKNISLNLEVYSNAEGCGLLASANRFGKIFFGNQFILNDIWKLIIKLISYTATLILLISYPFYPKKWQKIMSIIMILVVLPSHSGYYCLLYIFPGIVAFLNEEEHESKDWVYLACFIIIMWDYICKIQVFLNYNLALPVVLFLLCFTGLRQIVLCLKNRMIL